MFNLTDSPILIDLQWKTKILKCLDEAYKLCKDIYPIFHNHNIKIKINENVLNADDNFIYDLFLLSEYKINNVIKKNLWFSGLKMNDQQEYRKGLKILFLSLWKNNVLLLPINFDLSLLEEDIKLYFMSDNFLYKMTYDEDLKNKLTKSQRDKVKQAAKLLIFSNNWVKINDVNINDLTNLQIEVGRNRNENKNKLLKSLPPFNNLYRLIQEKNPDFGYETELYSQWISGLFARIEIITYQYFKDNFKEIKEINRKRKLRDTHILRISKKQNVDKVYAAQEFDNNSSSIELTFLKFNKTKRNWPKEPPDYINDFDIDNFKLSERWRYYFSEYLKYRQKRGYEDNKTAISALNFLGDYIFFYLRNFLKNKDLPIVPKQFIRTIYVIRIGDNKNFNTITELIEMKSSSNEYRNILLSNLYNFFEFLSDYEEISDVGKNFKNPFKADDKYIAYKDSKKSNKEVIPKEIVPIFKQYLYALENFGEFLQYQFMNSFLDNNKIKKIEQKTEYYGYIPFVTFNGKNIPIYDVTNVFKINRRSFIKFNPNHNYSVNTNEHIKGRYIPHLAPLRSILVALNTGLRMAQVRWLDIETWDKFNKSGDIKFIYQLNVNTDKFKNNSWQSMLPTQARECLLKESDFSNSMLEEFSQEKFIYQNRESSRFGKIKPIFRGTTGNTLAEDQYRAVWAEILYNFQNWYNLNFNKNHTFITLKKNTKIPLMLDGAAYCELTIAPIYTPHSMRVTFCTHMSEYLKIEDVAKLVGHANSIITSDVYVKPDISKIEKQVLNSHNILDGVNADYFSENSLAHIQPQRENSALQKAFAINKEETIELFKVSSISMSINSESEEQQNKAIKILKDARMDYIIFETTHICPVGGQCPTEVMSIIQEKRRCGLCPLALKCIDHLNPIYAKQRDLMREIKDGQNNLNQMIKKNEAVSLIKKVEDKVNLDLQELISWKFTTDILSFYYENIKNDPELAQKYHVEMPDMVKQHLTKVSVSNEKEYLLTRIADAQAYTQFNNPENRYKADILKRNLIKNLYKITEDDYHIDENDKINNFCNMIKQILDANNINIKQLINYENAKLTCPNNSLKLPSLEKL